MSDSSKDEGTVEELESPKDDVRVAVGVSPIEELKLKYKGQDDLDELRFILSEMLSYPSTELAKLHRDSNKLGSYDIKHE